MSLADREALRQRLRDQAVAEALNHHVTPLCRGHIALGTDNAKHGCSGKWNCLCTCHDEPPA